MLDKAKSFEQSRDIFGLNNMLKSEDFSIKHEPPKSIFYDEEQALTRLKEKIEEIAPCPSDNQEQALHELSM